MAFLGIAVPNETARLLSGIPVPGRKESRDRLHITMLFLGSTLPIGTVQKATGVLHGVMTSAKPFTVKTEKVTCFPKGEDGVPIICKIESPELMALRAEVAAAFDAAGIEFSKKFAYSPHVTLAYADDPIKDTTLPTVEWGVHEVVLWGGDDGDSSISVTFPMTLSLPTKVAWKHAGLL